MDLHDTRPQNGRQSKPFAKVQLEMPDYVNRDKRKRQIHEDVPACRLSVPAVETTLR